ncbi:unnamed protein product [Arabidopsis lyrata]|nr:unnamed protein product [Arabidopsis lyrata]
MISGCSRVFARNFVFPPCLVVLLAVRLETRGKSLFFSPLRQLFGLVFSSNGLSRWVLSCSLILFVVCVVGSYAPIVSSRFCVVYGGPGFSGWVQGAAVVSFSNPSLARS